MTTVFPASRMLIELGRPRSMDADPPGLTAQTRRCVSCPSDDEQRLAVATSYASGFEAGRAQAALDRAALTIALETDLRAQFEAKYSTLAGDVLDRLEAAFAHVMDETARSSARLLGTFFAGKIRDEALESMAAELRSLLAERAGVRVHLRGPGTLIVSLRPLLSSSEGSITVEESDDIEIVAIVDQVAVSTAIGSWINLIEKAT